MIVADTHALIWWILEPEALSAAARTALENDVIGIAAISCWEIATLARRGRIELNDDATVWPLAVAELPNIQLLPLSVEVAVLAANLPAQFPGDPGDRLITATALHYGVPLVTKDGKIRGAAVAETIW